MLWVLVTANAVPSSLILVTLMMEALSCLPSASGTYDSSGFTAEEVDVNCYSTNQKEN
jgi:hypothetical protein